MSYLKTLRRRNTARVTRWEIIASIGLAPSFFQQSRLFFRYHADARLIVFTWVNDDDSKRVYESNDDTYRVFRKMLESGHPPDDWNQLLAQA